MSGEAAVVLEYLDKGLELESKGIEFYSKAAEEIKDPKGRQTLQYLAGEEKDHLRFIADLKKAYQAQSEFELSGLVRSHLLKHSSRIFPPLEEFVSEVRKTSGDQQILEKAEEIEKRSIELYENGMKKSATKNDQKIFRILIGEEKEHLALVSQMKDYMILHGVWSGLEDHFANE